MLAVRSKDTIKLSDENINWKNSNNNNNNYGNNSTSNKNDKEQIQNENFYYIKDGSEFSKLLNTQRRKYR